MSGADYLRFFTEDLWAASGLDSGLYRPLLLASLTLDAKVFGDWIPGYHLVNILLHVVVSLLVFGLCRQVLRGSRVPSATAIPAACLAALVFAVHPVHTEVVRRFDSSVDPVTERWMESTGYWCPHDAEFLNWRYLDHPVNDYTAIAAISEAGDPVGYTVVRSDGPSLPPVSQTEIQLW